ncbi:MAG: hypothetical protein N3C12_06915 [Candidatus Binatia bacterium]|nr:hypothetical protein [Candidatus Binatia bacterium]
MLSRPWQPIYVGELFAAEHRGTEPRAALQPSELAEREQCQTVDPPLDSRALAEFRRRLHDIGTELDSAERHNDLGLLRALTEEREWLLHELGRAQRARVTSPEAERARQAVSKSIRRAIERLSNHCQALALHLRATVHCGVQCCYRPPPESQIRWHVVLPQ